MHKFNGYHNKNQKRFNSWRPEEIYFSRLVYHLIRERERQSKHVQRACGYSLIKVVARWAKVKQNKPQEREREGLLKFSNNNIQLD